MFNRFTLINILLLIALIFLAKQTLRLWSETPIKVESSSIQKTKEKTGWLPLNPKVMPPKNSFRAISDKNLFHPQRKWGEGVKKEEQNSSIFTQKPESKEIILYGILVFDDYRFAILGEGKGPRQKEGTKKVAVGDSFAGYQVVEISLDKVVLENEDEIETILLYKPKTDRNISPTPPVTRPSIIPPRSPRVPQMRKLPPTRSLPEIFRGASEKSGP